MKPNAVFFAVAGSACTLVVTAALLLAYASGRRRARRWPRKAGAA